MIKIMNLIGIKSRKASEKKINLYTKNKVLNLYAKLLDKENKSILRENLKDIKFAKSKGIKENLINRLQIDEVKLKNIRDSVIKISKLKDPVNVTLKKWSRPNGLNIKRVTIPIGVIGVIFESRPNVTSDVAGLCFKSGNAVILKGGSEAINTNRILAKLFRQALKKNNVDENYIQFVNSSPLPPLVNFLGALFVELLNLVFPSPPLPPIATTNSSPLLLKSNSKVLLSSSKT